ncbi:DUF4761 family protein [Escherichia coli]|nr:DUF4761 family protein [Escherichia coli]
MHPATEHIQTYSDTSASRSNIRYSLSDTHATPDGYPVKQIGEHAWLIEKAGIVIHKCPRNPFNGRAYLVGLAMTDTPASLGTERLKFTAQQRQAVMTFNSVQGEAPLISEAIESEIIEMAEQRQEEGTQWFNRVMGIIGRGRKADDASFSRIQEAVEGVATSQADIIDRFNVLETRHQQDRQKITSLTTELTALKEKLRTQDGDPQNRFTATGAASDQLADF